MANFKGFKQVSLSTYLATSEENRKDYLWFVREFSGETVVSTSIYFGNRKYADLAELTSDKKIQNLITSLGGIVDENGEWLGFFPTEEHEILGSSGITNAAEAVSALEAAILANADAIESAERESKKELDEAVSALTENINEIDSKVDASVSALTEDINSLDDKVDTAVSALTASIDELDNKVDDAVSSLSSNIESLDNKVGTSVSALTEDINELDSKVDGSVSALTAEINKKANSADVYTKDQVYTKAETDAKIAGAFKFKGNAESVSQDETTIIIDSEHQVVASEENRGWVYQIGDKEYASNASVWVELGFNIDLSPYATIDYVDSAITESNQRVDEVLSELELTESALTEEIAQRRNDVADLNNAISTEREERMSDVSGLTESIIELQNRFLITGEDVEE